MKKNRSLCNCLNCNRFFSPEPRNRVRQRFCGEATCQKARRAHNQRKRRRRKLSEATTGAEMKPSEAICVADWMSQNVGLVGLISKLADTVETDAVEAAVRRMLERGFKVTAKLPVTVSAPHD